MKNFALLICASLASFSTSLAISDDHLELPVFGGANDDGIMEHWLTTGNDMTQIGDDGKAVKQNYVHDVQFVGNKIKRINVYSKPGTN